MKEDANLAGPDRMAMMATFVRIVDSGSLSAAAVQLGTTQPTVSRRLQALERSLGVRLLQRSTHAMKLTDDGRRCYERAKDLIAAWESFESEIRGAGDEPVGMLRVVAPHAIGQHQLVVPLAAYLQRYPRMTVEWLLHDRSPDFIAEGIDCAIHVGPVHDPSVVALRVGEIPRVVVAAPAVIGKGKRPREPADLAKLPWIALRTFYRDEVVLANAKTGETTTFPIRPRLVTDGLYALQTAALMGVGAALGSAWLLGADIVAGRLLQLTPGWSAAPLPIYLVYPPVRFQPARLRRFIEAMREALPRVDGFAIK